MNANAPTVTLLLGRSQFWRIWLGSLACVSTGLLAWVLVWVRWWTTHPSLAMLLLFFQAGLAWVVFKAWHRPPLAYLQFQTREGRTQWQWREGNSPSWQLVWSIRVVVDAQRWVLLQCQLADGSKHTRWLSHTDAGPQRWHAWRSVLFTGAT